MASSPVRHDRGVSLHETTHENERMLTLNYSVTIFPTAELEDSMKDLRQRDFFEQRRTQLRELVLYSS